MSFPTSPTNGQTVVINNTVYTYNSGLGTWSATISGTNTPIVLGATSSLNIANTTTSTSTTTGALTVAGGLGVSGSIYAGNITTSGTVAMSSAYTMRNKIINGAMVIDQRNAGGSFTPTSDGGYGSVDRWQYSLSQSSKFSSQQNAGSVTPPTGFNYYAGITSLSSYTVGSSDYFMFNQAIEGYNIADLSWGTSGAKTVTISFWVYSSLTGTFGGCLQNSSQNRSYPFSYTISSSNTWTYITITIPGDTAGTWNTNNTQGIILRFGLGVGSTYSGTAGSWSGNKYFTCTGATSVVGTNGATFYITGVQLEIGTAATPFEYRNYQQELAMAQRYYAKTFSQGTAPADNVTTTGALRGTARLINASSQIEPAANWKFPVTMRTNPTVTLYSSGTGTTTGQWNNDGSTSYSANARTQFISDSNVDINNAGVLLTASTPWQIQAIAVAEL